MVMVETKAAVAGELKKAWGWLLAWGIILLVAGVVGLGYEFSVSVVTTLFVGGLLVVYGVIEVVQAFRHQKWQGFFLFLIGGILSIVAGALANIVAKTGKSETEARAVLTAGNPQGRMVQAAEVANAVMWLLLPGSEAITGQSIAVAGGELM